MTPAARIASAILILDDILAGEPAERALTRWARNNRFAGSGDRNAIRDHVYGALRCRNSFAARGGSLTGRGLMIGASADPESIFTGIGHAPAALTGEERAHLALAPQETPANLPQWLAEAFYESLSEARAVQAIKAQDERAQVHLRVNTAKTSRTAAMAMLADELIETEAHPDVATALIVTSNPRKVQTSQAYLEGMVELQDASSQAAILRLPLPEKTKVLDYCAGGGGKALAIAARVRAKVYAHDISPARMTDLPARAERAGVKIATLPTKDLKTSAPYGVVFIDAPCSGSGTWRRAPDAKWRFTEQDLSTLTATQSQILDEAQHLVAKDGLLAYATCSVLTAENEANCAAFLARNSAWEMVDEMRLDITPTNDGFYLATFRRKA